MNYQKALETLNGKPSRKIGNNTRLEIRNTGIAIRLHDTDILLFHPDGTVTLNSGGWRTVTTKARMNEYLVNARVFQKKHEWFVARYEDIAGWNAYALKFYDGMVLA